VMMSVGLILLWSIPVSYDKKVAGSARRKSSAP
jgi:hypothetical protein